MALARNKELRIFEALENLTKHESFDDSASFVHRFVNHDLDLNNTHQSVPLIPPEEDRDHALLSLSPSQSGSGSENHTFDVGDDDSYIIVIGDEEGVDTKTNSEAGNDVSPGQRSCEEDEDSEDSQSVYSLSDEEEENGSPNPNQGFQSAAKSKGADADDELEELLQVLKKKHGTEYLFLSEMKRTVQLQESQLRREQEAFATEKNAEEAKFLIEKKRVESQRKNLQTLFTDYHKMKSSKDESQQKISELTEKLKETKLEMSKRISRWGAQQKKLEERVKALEKENEELKNKNIGVPSRPPRILKRPPIFPKSNLTKTKPKSNKNLKRIQFADANDRVEVENVPADCPSTSKSDAGAEKSKTTGISVKEVSLDDDDADKTMPADYIEITRPCGTITRVTKDKNFTRQILINKDIMDEFEDCSVRYYYRELGFSQTSYPNGDEVIEYDSGMLETSRSDGSKIFTYSDGLVKLVDPSGTEEVYFVDGSVMKQEPNGGATITWPSGQKEVRTSTYVKRIYTNGTVKTLFADGSEETCYWNGRVRRKNKDGVLVEDTKKKMK